MLVDSHCHLDFPEFAPEARRRRGARQGRGRRRLRQHRHANWIAFPRVREIAERFADVWCSVGVHPHEAEKELLDSPAPLVEAARHPKVVGIGETGLDYYYEHSPRAAADRQLSRPYRSGAADRTAGDRSYARRR